MKTAINAALIQNVMWYHIPTSRNVF